MRLIRDGSMGKVSVFNFYTGELPSLGRALNGLALNVWWMQLIHVEEGHHIKDLAHRESRSIEDLVH